MKNKRLVYIFAAFLLITACKQNISYNNEEAAIQESSTYFTVGTKDQRAAFPEYKNDSFDQYILKGSLNSEETDFGSFTSYSLLSSKKFEITEGEWTFNLTASKGQTIYTGSVTKTIVKGANSLIFELKPVQLDLENGKGNIKFELTVPAEISNITYSLLDFENQTPITDFTSITTNVTNKKSLLSLEEVPAGTYYIDAILYTSDNVKVNTYRTVASVCDGVTSKGSFTINQINTVYTITFSPGHYSFVDGSIIPASFTMFEDITITLPDASDISAPFNFLGWYLSNDFSGEAVTTLTPSEPANILVYPKWGNEITCTAQELKEYITDFSNTKIVVHITDSKPDLSILRDALNKNQTVTVKLDLDACLGLTYFSYYLDECNNLTSVSIPCNVTSLGYQIFSNCYNLEEINYNAKNIESVSGDWLYQRNTGNNTNGLIINIGAGVETIPENFISQQYNNHAKIKTINFADNSVLKTIGKKAFYNLKSVNELNLPSSVETIKENAFQGCTAIKELIISENMKNIETYAFENCDNLKNVRILNTDVSLGSNPFYKSKIENIYFPGTYSQWSDFCNGSAKINCNEEGSNLYLNNVLLTELLFNDDSITVSKAASSNLKNVTKISIGENVNKIFGEFGVLKDLETIYYNATNCLANDNSRYYYLFGQVTGSSEGVTVIIGNKVTKIPSYVFQASTSSSAKFNLTNVTFEETSVCEEIGEKAFYNNKNIKDLYLPKSITVINNYAFPSSGIENVHFDGSLVEWYSNIDFKEWNANPLYNNEANLYVNKNELVEELVFPEGTTDAKMNRYAFAGCKSLKKIVIPESIATLPEIESAYYVEEFVYGPSSSDFDFENTYNGYYSRMGYKVENGLKLIIGKSVTKIPDYFSKSGIDPVEINFEDNCTCSEIGEEAFAELRKLKRVTIPESITKIGEKAFAGGYYDYDKSIMEEIIYNAKNAQSAAWSWTDSCFKDSGEKTEGGIKLIIGAEVESINENIFYNTNISSVVFEGTKISKFAEDAFVKCSIYKVEYPGDQSQWESIVFENQNSSPCCNGASLYFDGTKVTSIAFEEGTKRIPDGIYSGCKDITTVTLPSTLTTIGSYCFYNCSGITEITIPESVEEINKSPFSGCRGLTEINYNAAKLTNNIVNHGGMFTYAGVDTEGCTVNFGQNVIEIPNSIFQSATSIIKVNFAANSKLQIISDFAFCNMTGLTEITIPDTVQKIDRGAFEGTSIKSIIIPDSVTYMDTEICRGCKLLESVTIGSGITKIEHYDFYLCENLKEVTFIDTSNWYKNPFFNYSAFNDEDKIDVTDTQANAELLKTGDYYLFKKE